VIPGEEAVVYDREDPPMYVGTIYTTIHEFRAAGKQHAIKEQFELGTEKSCKKNSGVITKPLRVNGI